MKQVASINCCDKEDVLGHGTCGNGFVDAPRQDLSFIHLPFVSYYFVINLRKVWKERHVV
jgi:hypothetical protein